MTGFDATSTADDVLANTDLSGRTVMITGGSSGLGEESARAMAARGGRVVLASRSPDQLAQAKARIEAAVADAAIDTLVLDLGSLSAISRAADDAKDRFERIDILMNNAGVMACAFEQTADGFERQFGTNHLGHFAWTLGLLPLLRAADGARVVTLSSRAHFASPVHFDDPHYRRRDYEKWEAYGQSKTANVQFAVGLDARLRSDGIDCVAVHPGGIATNLGRHLSEADTARLLERVRKTAEKGGTGMKTVEQGAATQCWAATTSDLRGRGGVYCEDCGVAEIIETSETHGVRPYAVDRENAERLWTLSERETGANPRGVKL